MVFVWVIDNLGLKILGGIENFSLCFCFFNDKCK